MNFKTTIVLLILLSLVAGYFYLVEKDKPATELVTRADTSTPLFKDGDIDAEKIETLTIVRGSDKVVIKKSDKDWNQTEPVAFPLNGWSVSRIPEDAKVLAYSDSFKPGVNERPTLEQAGLKPPQAEVTFAGKDGSHTIKLGKKLTIGGSGYAMIDSDEKVYIVDEALHDSLLKQPVKDWRKKSLTSLKEGEAKHITITRSDGGVEIVKTEGTWALEGNASGRVATKAVSDLLSAFSGIYIADFEADQPKDLGLFGLVKPAAVFRIESGDDKVTELKVGSAKGFKDDHFFATLDDGKVVFSISKADKEKFAKSAADLRDKRVTIVPANDIKAVKLEAPSREAIVVERSDKGWKFTSAEPGYAPDGGLIADRLDALAKVEADSFIAGFKPSSEPAATLTLTATGRADPDVLEVYAGEKDDQRVVVRNSESTGYVVKADKIVDVTGPLLTWRDRTVLDITGDKVNQFSLTRPDGLTLNFQREAAADDATKTPGKWTLAGADSFENAAFDSLRVYFAPLLADRWADQGKPGKDSYVVKINDQTVTIDPASMLATATGVDGVFQVSKAMIDALGAELRDRTLLSAGVDDIKSVKVGDVTITKNADKKYVDASGNELDQSAAAGVIDTLAGLRVERYLNAPTGDATTTFEIAIGDGVQTLTLHAENTGKLGDKAFELAKGDVEKLTRKLSK